MICVIRGWTRKGNMNLAELAKMYWKVSRCWNAPKGHKEKMSFERAMKDLRIIRVEAFPLPGGIPLSVKAYRLMQEIVNNHVDSAPKKTAK